MNSNAGVQLLHFLHGHFFSTTSKNIDELNKTTMNGNLVAVLLLSASFQLKEAYGLAVKDGLGQRNPTRPKPFHTSCFTAFSFLLASFVGKKRNSVFFSIYKFMTLLKVFQFLQDNLHAAEEKKSF